MGLPAPQPANPARAAPSAEPARAARPKDPAPKRRGAPRLAMLGEVLHRLRTSLVQFHVGQVVVGDDPFNGRREGRVEVVRPPYVGLRIPGTPAGTLVFFDHRTVRFPD